MKVFRTTASFLRWRKSVRKNLSIGFVPTMGALHEGHLSLVKKSFKDCDLTVVSIFVNPTQFGPNEDFQKYPRTEKEDLALLKKAGVDAVYMPKDPGEVYSSADQTQILPRAQFTKILEGRFRPGHFEGVVSVVAKLFGIVSPQRAYFGEKDYQQLQVITAMVADLFMPIKIVPCPTLREKSGLAMSSRNRYLEKEDRELAAALHRVLKTAPDLESGRNQLLNLGFILDYLECWSLDLMEERPDGYGRWLVAARFKGVRLIDNLRR